MDAFEKDLLARARGLTRLSDGEVIKAIRIHVENYWFRYRSTDTSRINEILLRNTFTIIMEYCSELHRRRTGKHTFEPTAYVYRFDAIHRVVKLSDIVPHVVDTGSSTQ